MTGTRNWKKSPRKPPKTEVAKMMSETRMTMKKLFRMESPKKGLAQSPRSS
jgi:hypothetical protein